ncbi:hypothetical protein ACH5RR_007213 [Cinchona calisaya]|uniref:Protein kinase domain-containing protein n=1 Tax=Cinchona calisaya TaxID=153742 RepID=A0ABD3AR37_9GENT
MKEKNMEENDQEKFGDGVSWSRGRTLGKGSFGSVYLASLKNPRSKYSCFPSIMAVKSAEVSNSNSLQKEREVLCSLIGCTNIINCYGEETTFGYDGLMVYNLLLEYGSGGSLAERIKKSGKKGLPEAEVKCFTKSILKGLDWIHETGYVHCDLKPDNILLVPNSRRGSVYFIAKICDFGLAKKRVKVQQRVPKKRKLENYWRGTPMYISPEAVTESQQEAPSDVWSLGCIVLEMLTGKPAWELDEESLNAENVLLKIKKVKALPKIPRGLSVQAKSFLRCCLVRNAKKRFSAEELLNHPFVEGLEDDDDNDNDDEFEEEIEEVDRSSCGSNCGDWDIGFDEDCVSYGASEEIAKIAPHFFEDQICSMKSFEIRQPYAVAFSLAARI